MSTLYTESLDPLRLQTYQKLSNFADEFVLSGGTAIMLQINHRKSFDFDCFSPKPLKKTLARQARQIFGNGIEIQISNTDLFLFTTPKGIKIDFAYYPYPRLHPLNRNKPIPLFNIKDLASNKAYTIGRRATWRDYVDLFFLLKWQVVDLNNTISDAKTKFGGEFSEKLFLEQLVYFDDIKIMPIHFLQEPYTPEQIQDFLKSQAQKVTENKLK